MLRKKISRIRYQPIAACVHSSTPCTNVKLPYWKATVWRRFCTAVQRKKTKRNPNSIAVAIFEFSSISWRGYSFQLFTWAFSYKRKENRIITAVHMHRICIDLVLVRFLSNIHLQSGFDSPFKTVVHPKDSFDLKLRFNTFSCNLWEKSSVSRIQLRDFL